MTLEQPRIRTLRTVPSSLTERDQELINQQQQRSNSQVPIYVFWTTDVPRTESAASVAGVYDAVIASGQGRQVVVLGSESYGRGRFSSPDWYVQEALRRQSMQLNHGHGPQVLASQIIRLFRQEPWQANPHWEVMITGHDLTDYGDNGLLNFVFGVTDTTFPASLQSVRRLVDEVTNPNLRAAMVRRLLAHEVGHMFGLPSRNYRVEQKLGLHCTNICCMRQGLSIPEWADLTVQERRYQVTFCQDCREDLSRIRSRLAF